MKKPIQADISSLGLHLLAMLFMLCDHLWATIIPGNSWLTWIGRLAFPVFAFLLTEGYFHTRNFKKYLGRLLLFALLSEIPFNLMYTGSWFFPFHQNVLWSFALSLVCMRWIDRIRSKYRLWLSLPLAAAAAFVCILLGQLLMVDYYGFGIMTVLIFYLFRGRSWPTRLGQLFCMFYIHWYLIGSMRIPLEFFGLPLELPQQGIAVLALLPIWLYRGRQGPRNKGIQYLFYSFYPVHMLILALLSQ